MASYIQQQEETQADQAKSTVAALGDNSDDGSDSSQTDSFSSSQT